MRRGRLAALVCLLGFGTVAAVPQQQERPTITIQLLNSRNGKPVESDRVELWPDNNHDHVVMLSTGADGKVSFVPPNGLDRFVVIAHNPADGWNFFRCDWDKKQPVTTPYSVAHILSQGIAAPNHCSRRSADAKPGEFILFVRPATIWEKMAS